jgi:AraC family transcriptional regulator of adaptative response / DNA-3-methyladenine glycosylase II
MHTDELADDEWRYRAVASRDARFDGWFVSAVTTTRIYCRPSCPALTPIRAHIRFLPTAAAAQQQGFRACLRCRPDAAPGSPEWNHRADVVARAVRLINDGTVDRGGVPGLAQRLGYTPRHLGRLLQAELGAGPLALARAQRAQTARILIETTGLGLAEIAFAAGFGSVRQFNDTIRSTFGRTPSALRDTSTARRATPRGGRVRPHAGGTSAEVSPRTSEAVPTTSGADLGAVTLRLAYREPLHAEALTEFFALRTVPGVDEVVGQMYRRALRLPHGPGLAELKAQGDHVRAVLRLADLRDLAPAVARCRRLFDLDADPIAIDAALAADPALAASVAKDPGVRVPGAADGFEIAVRAVVGQQISVVAARRVLGTLVRATADPEVDPGALDPGPVDPDQVEPGRVKLGAVDAGQVEVGTRLTGFPTAEQIADANDAAFAMPTARRSTLRALAEAVATGALVLDPGADRADTIAGLLALPGIGAWTARYIALRALGDPDVLLDTDLGVRRGARALGLPDDPAALTAHARRHWAPWRSYATIRLWRYA